ncbi:DUF1272 domain-containing protein [Pseudaminobacter sp. 19-2017]|uniref:DUF1272 domain-containing protein n=1 Tax=Pseudaminobacter soli (ex Zhang et al. 2022) TaxID=2831468 RepID=A0A942E562_9HYPH|nr:DUF1272 domain-containing protein [Pseudaminobacter soli]MBS3651176.1 DUF1272 domain-containing protein [Pseudaminobacter soli]
MLELRPNCECCDRDLSPDSPDARICTYECTFCSDCVDRVLGGVCPNCGGNFVARPIRPAAMLAKNPAATKRVLKAEGCLPVAPRAA